ncbi:MAG: GNAT family N-acetyltransferase [Nocardioidaceae bacterium]
MLLRRFVEADAEAVLKLNEESVWALSPLDLTGLRTHQDSAAHCVAVEEDGQVAAFAIAYAPGSGYDSVNYLWFAGRFDEFFYLDRIAVGKTFRRRGIATLIYDELETRAAPHLRMVCEVNSDPPNLGSLAFHQARGYREIGHLVQPDGHETVMLEKPL